MKRHDMTTPWGFLRTLLLLICLTLCLAMLSGADLGHAADHYIRMDATGANDGTDLTNAWTALPATLTRGDTYYMAGHGPDSLYVDYTFDDAVNGTNAITVKRVTSDQSAIAGYASWMASEQVVMSGIDVATSYIFVDGVTGGGYGAWADNFGIMIAEYDELDNCVTLSNDCTNITIQHVKLHSNQVNHVYGIKGTTSTSHRYITVSHCMIDSLFGCPFHAHAWSDVLIEQSYIASNKSTTYHTEGISSTGDNNDWVIKNNLWYDIRGTAVIAGINIGSANRWHIYGNTFGKSCITIRGYYVAEGANQYVFNNCLFFHNNVVGMNGDYSYAAPYVEGSGTGNYAWNNIYWDNECNSGTCYGFTHDYNAAGNNIRFDNQASMDAALVTDEVNGVSGISIPFADYDSLDIPGSDFRVVTGLFAENEGTTAALDSIPDAVTDPAGGTRNITLLAMGAYADTAGSASSDTTHVTEYTPPAAAMDSLVLILVLDADPGDTIEWPSWITIRDSVGVDPINDAAHYLAVYQDTVAHNIYNTIFDGENYALGDTVRINITEMVADLPISAGEWFMIFCRTAFQPGWSYEWFQFEAYEGSTAPPSIIAYLNGSPIDTVEIASGVDDVSFTWTDSTLNKTETGIRIGSMAVAGTTNRDGIYRFQYPDVGTGDGSYYALLSPAVNPDSTIVYFTATDEEDTTASFSATGDTLFTDDDLARYLLAIEAGTPETPAATDVMNRRVKRAIDKLINKRIYR